MQPASDIAPKNGGPATSHNEQQDSTRSCNHPALRVRRKGPQPLRNGLETVSNGVTVRNTKPGFPVTVR